MNYLDGKSVYYDHYWSDSYLPSFPKNPKYNQQIASEA